MHEHRRLELRDAGVVLAVAAVGAGAAAEHDVLAREIAQGDQERVPARVGRAGVAGLLAMGEERVAVSELARAEDRVTLPAVTVALGAEPARARVVVVEAAQEVVDVVPAAEGIAAVGVDRARSPGTSSPTAVCRLTGRGASSNASLTAYSELRCGLRPACRSTSTKTSGLPSS